LTRFGWSIALLVAIAIVAFVFGPKQYRIWQTKREVASTLRDPESAQFDKLTVNDDAVCGLVNGRNGYGGMAGAVPFIHRRGKPVELAPMELASEERSRERLNEACDAEIDIAVRLGRPDDVGTSASCVAFKKSLNDQIAFLNWIKLYQKACG
jgi:hypothetical protein